MDFANLRGLYDQALSGDDYLPNDRTKFANAGGVVAAYQAGKGRDGGVVTKILQSVYTEVIEPAGKALPPVLADISAIQIEVNGLCGSLEDASKAEAKLAQGANTLQLRLGLQQTLRKATVAIDKISKIQSKLAGTKVNSEPASRPETQGMSITSLANLLKGAKSCNGVADFLSKWNDAVTNYIAAFADRVAYEIDFEELRLNVNCDLDYNWWYFIKPGMTNNDYVNVVSPRWLREKQPDKAYYFDLNQCGWWINKDFWGIVETRYKERLFPKMQNVAAATITRDGPKRHISRPERIEWDFLKSIYAFVPASAPDPFFHTTALWNNLIRRYSLSQALVLAWRTEDTLKKELTQYTQAHRQLSRTLSRFGAISYTLQQIEKYILTDLDDLLRVIKVTIADLYGNIASGSSFDIEVNRQELRESWKRLQQFQTNLSTISFNEQLSTSGSVRYGKDKAWHVDGIVSHNAPLYGIGTIDLGNSGTWEIKRDVSKDCGSYYKPGTGTEFFLTQLNWASPRPPTQKIQIEYISVETGDAWNSSNGRTLDIRFEKTWPQVPVVRVWITEFAVANTRNFDINVYCYEVNRSGYKLRIDKLAGHKIDKLTIAWLVHASDEPTMFSAPVMCKNIAYLISVHPHKGNQDHKIMDGSLQTENWMSDFSPFAGLSSPYSPGQLVEFPEGRFDQPPVVFVAAKRLKFHKSANIRLTCPVLHVTKNGALVQPMTWWDSKLYEAYYEVIAFA